jgi:hypothetical protein
LRPRGGNRRPARSTGAILTVRALYSDQTVTAAFTPDMTVRQVVKGTGIVPGGRRFVVRDKDGEIVNSEAAAAYAGHVLSVELDEVETAV